jgi:hypothetical protein
MSPPTINSTISKTGILIRSVIEKQCGITIAWIKEAKSLSSSLVAGALQELFSKLFIMTDKVLSAYSEGSAYG